MGPLERANLNHWTGFEFRPATDNNASNISHGFCHFSLLHVISELHLEGDQYVSPHSLSIAPFPFILLHLTLSYIILLLDTASLNELTSNHRGKRMSTTLKVLLKPSIK
jgi:hypothetical protein